MKMSTCAKCGTTWTASMGLPMCPVCGGGLASPLRPASTKIQRGGSHGTALLDPPAVAPPPPKPKAPAPSAQLPDFEPDLFFLVAEPPDSES
jgi:hypothetical protein